MNGQRFNERFEDGGEFIPGHSTDYSDAVQAAGSRIPAKAQPTQPEHDFAVPAESHTPVAEERIAGDPLTEASIGPADKADSPKAIACDTSGLRKLILETLLSEVIAARAAETRYADLCREAGEIMGPALAIERKEREICNATSLSEIRAGLQEIAILKAGGPYSSSTAERILRRSWCTDVLPKVRALIEGFRQKLAEWERTLEVEKRRLHESFGYLGIGKMLESDNVLVALKRELEHFDAAVKRNENLGPLGGIPGVELIKTFAGIAY